LNTCTYYSRKSFRKAEVKLSGILINIRKQVSITTAEVRNDFILESCSTLHIKGTEKAFVTYENVFDRNDFFYKEGNIISIKKLVHSAGLAC